MARLVAPGVLVRSAPYWWTQPDNIDAVTIDDPIERIGEPDLPIAVRRWIASRLAWAAREYLSQAEPTLGGLLAALPVLRRERPEAVPRLR